MATATTAMGRCIETMTAEAITLWIGGTTEIGTATAIGATTDRAGQDASAPGASGGDYERPDLSEALFGTTGVGAASLACLLSCFARFCFCRRMPRSLSALMASYSG